MTTPNPKNQPTAKNTPHSPSRVLLAEDNGEMRDLLALTLRAEGYEVHECTHGMELLQHLKPLFNDESIPFDVIVSDIRMPGVTGLEVLEGVHQEAAPCPPVLLITAFGDEDTHAMAKSCGVYTVLDKPFTLDKLIAAVKDALE